MSLPRRTFVRLAAATGGLLGVAPTAAARALAAPRTPDVFVPTRRAPLRILILGGTGFIGPYQVQYALDRGHTVTLFNRGKTNPGLFPTVEKLQGDRATDSSRSRGATGTSCSTTRPPIRSGSRARPSCWRRA
jgi:2'-hydroxyisoflavone reductase